MIALDDPELEIKMSEREPPDLQAPYKTAIRLETLKKASSSREAATTVTLKETIKPSKAARAVQELADRLSLETFKEETTRQRNDWKAEKQREIKELQAENSRLRQNSQPKPNDLVTVSALGWAWAATPTDGVQRDFSKITCFTCGQKGYTSTVCRKKGMSKAGPPAEGAKAKTPPEERACFICEKKDHLFRNCPLKVSPARDDAKSPPKGDNASSCGTMGHHTKEAYLEIQVNGRYYNCLLDTGSDVTIFQYAMMKGHTLHPTTTTVMSANGTPIPLLGRATVNAIWNGKAIQLSGVVTEHMDEIVLGLTLFQERGAVFNFKTGRLTIDGESHLRLDGVDAVICRWLIVQESDVIPARSQMDIPAKTV